jgi:hypothetical protein
VSELATRRAPITAVDTTARTITARLVTWDDPRTVVDPDGSRYTETFAPRSLEPLDDTYVVDEHGGQLIGHMDGHRDDGDGHTADLHIADTAAGRDLLALVDAGTIRHVSIEFDQRGGAASWNAQRDAVTRTTAALHGVAFAFRPAHTAPILAVRNEEPPVSMTLTDNPMPTPVVHVNPADADDILAVRSELVAMREELAARAAAAVHPLARYGSLAEYANAVWDDPVLAARTLADQITTNNAGVVPPGWIRDVKGVLDKGRPSINALGGPAPLPSSGMDVSWPYFDGNLAALVGVQTTQKTEITSVRVDLKKGTATLKTFAGGSDISYQLIRRSDPSYLDAYLRIMTSAWGFVTDNDFIDTLVAGATGTGTLDTSTATALTTQAALINASLAVQAATGQPASVALVSSDWMTAFAGMSGIYASQYGTANVQGTMDASSLQLSIAGLPIVYEPNLTAETIIVTNPVAARWLEDGPMVATAEDVAKLGHDVAVWGMGVTALYIPSGVVKLVGA